MQKLKESGVLRKILLDYFGSSTDEDVSSVSAEATELGFDNLFFPGFVAFLGMVAAAAVLAGELAGAGLRKEQHAQGRFLHRK